MNSGNSFAQSRDNRNGQRGPIIVIGRFRFQCSKNASKYLIDEQSSLVQFCSLQNVTDGILPSGIKQTATFLSKPQGDAVFFKSLMFNATSTIGIRFEAKHACYHPAPPANENPELCRFPEVKPLLSGYDNGSPAVRLIANLISVCPNGVCLIKREKSLFVRANLAAKALITVC